MTQLFLLTGIQAIDDLRLRIEAMLDEVRRLRIKAGKVRGELISTQERIKRMRETISHLRGSSCKIVSFNEYNILLSELQKAKVAEDATQHSLDSEELMVKRLIDSVYDLEKQIDVLQNTYGKVLEFKKRE